MIIGFMYVLPSVGNVDDRRGLHSLSCSSDVCLHHLQETRRAAPTPRGPCVGDCGDYASDYGDYARRRSSQESELENGASQDAVTDFD